MSPLKVETSSSPATRLERRTLHVRVLDELIVSGRGRNPPPRAWHGAQVISNSCPRSSTVDRNFWRLGDSCAGGSFTQGLEPSGLEPLITPNLTRYECFARLPQKPWSTALVRDRGTEGLLRRRTTVAMNLLFICHGHILRDLVVHHGPTNCNRAGRHHTSPHSQLISL